MALTDKSLVCRDCGQTFTFTVGEQEFYQSRGLQNEPKRCPQCRAARRASRPEAGSAPQKPVYTAVCAACGTQTTVPFEPREERPVYCRDCYAKMKNQALSPGLNVEKRL